MASSDPPVCDAVYWAVQYFGADGEGGCACVPADEHYSLWAKLTVSTPTELC
ncbi:MAG: hypothetical protein ACMUIL_02510 [bacterium]